MTAPSSGRAFVLLLAFLVLVVSLVLMVVDPGARKPEPWPSKPGDDVSVAPRALP